MKTNLTISDQIPDTELSALVAEHVAGMSIEIDPFTGEPLQILKDLFISRRALPRFATSAEAVLLLLAEYSAELNHVHREKIGWQWEVKVWDKSFFPSEASDASLPRACCLALLVLKGFTVTP